MRTVDKNKNWQVYIIEASDSKLYTGITTDIEQRWQSHASGKGAKFFRGRTPEKICYLEKNHDKSSASKREAEIKQLSRNEKLLLILSSPYQSP
jgi:putative endonuclease